VGEIMPVQQCRLAASDWLYIPAGYWHSTMAADESLSLSIGIRAPSAIDLFDRLREHLLASIEWRERLPPRRVVEGDRELRVQEIVSRLADRLKEELVADHFLQSVLADRWKPKVH
jgi:ribosomal protein L16 Arg81 hydroxylase